MKRILSIQDISCVGQCSTTVALPIISASGMECAILPPAILSNHTGGFKSWSFCDLTSQMSDIEAKWIEEGIKFDAFYTGYVCESHIKKILSIFSTCSVPGAVSFVDPAMADNGKLYAGFKDDFPEKMRALASRADYLIPNLTEAALLVDEDPLYYVERTSPLAKKDFENLIAKLHGIGAKNIVLTGVALEESHLGVAVSDGKEIAYDFNPRLRRMSHGTGDVFASVFIGSVMRGNSLLSAAAFAADIVCEAIEATDSDHWYGVSFEKVIGKIVKGCE
jgi:pyridoxine kinase